MIIGIGHDLIELSRIKKAAESRRFVERYFTEREQALFKQRHLNPAVIGGNFSVKESVSKVLGTGFRNFELTDIEVLRDELGKPYVTLSGNAKATSDALGIHTWHVTITNTGELVSTVAIGEK